MNVGDQVQWMDVQYRGSGMILRAMEGKILEIDGNVATVKRSGSGRRYQVKVTRLRTMDQVPELTELVMGKKQNR